MARPPIPEAFKRAAIIRNMRKNGGRLLCAETGEELTENEALNAGIHFDHNPPLVLRERIYDRLGFADDTDPGTYIPNANHLDALDVTGVKGHSIRTNKKRGLQRGDQTQRAHLRKVKESNDAHKEAMEAKARGEKPPKPKFKRKVPSRPLQTNRNGPWKKPLHGNAVRRT